MHGAMRDVLGIWAEGRPDVWWGQTRVLVGPDVSGWGRMRVWVGPIMWGVVEGCCWGSGMSLSGLGYVVRPGDMVGCMDCGTESAKAVVQRVARCDRQVGRGDGRGVMDEQAWPTWVDWHGEHGERDGQVQRVTGFG